MDGVVVPLGSVGSDTRDYSGQGGDTVNNGYRPGDLMDPRGLRVTINENDNNDINNGTNIK